MPTASLTKAVEPIKPSSYLRETITEGQMQRADNHISVVIPTLNEASCISSTIDSLREHDISEIVVSDGGSTDGTRDIVAAYDDVQLVESLPGRGRQINTGVATAKSPIVVILHADTQLPAGAVSQIRAALEVPKTVCGCFSLRFDVRSVPLQFYAWLSHYDSYWTTFGDQAFFFQSRDFQRIGGAPDWPLFEDVELRRRFKIIGHFKKLPTTVTTSARRFQAKGPIRTQLANAAMLLGYTLGISPIHLSALYTATLASKGRRRRHAHGPKDRAQEQAVGETDADRIAQRRVRSERIVLLDAGPGSGSLDVGDDLFPELAAAELRGAHVKQSDDD